MKTHKFFLLAIAMILAVSATAQNQNESKLSVVDWGLKLQANASNIVLREMPDNLSSTMNIGGEFGAFIDFNISKHFFIQFNLMYFAEHTDLTSNVAHDKLWTLGMEIPVYAMARFGDDQKGYFYFGAGPFTEFSLWADMSGDSGHMNPYKHVVGIDEQGEDQMALSDNHSGLGVCLGYELPCGLQINGYYQNSFSDILAFAHESHMSARPQKAMLGIAWRF